MEVNIALIVSYFFAKCILVVGFTAGALIILMTFQGLMYIMQTVKENLNNK